MSISQKSIPLNEMNDKFKLTVQNLGQFFNSRLGNPCVCHTIGLGIKTAELKVENSKAFKYLLRSPIKQTREHKGRFITADFLSKVVCL